MNRVCPKAPELCRLWGCAVVAPCRKVAGTGRLLQALAQPAKGTVLKSSLPSSLLPENVRSYQQSSGIRFETALGIAQSEGNQFFPSVTVSPIRTLKKGTNPLAFFRPKSAVRWASEEGTGLGQPVLRLSSGCRCFCGTPKSCGDYRAGNPSV